MPKTLTRDLRRPSAFLHALSHTWCSDFDDALTNRLHALLNATTDYSGEDGDPAKLREALAASKRTIALAEAEAEKYRRLIRDLRGLERALRSMLDDEAAEAAPAAQEVADA